MMRLNGERRFILISSYHGWTRSTMLVQRCYKFSRTVQKSGTDTGELYPSMSSVNSKLTVVTGSRSHSKTLRPNKSVMHFLALWSAPAISFLTPRSKSECPYRLDTESSWQASRSYLAKCMRRISLGPNLTSSIGAANRSGPRIVGRISQHGRVCTRGVPRRGGG